MLPEQPGTDCGQRRLCLSLTLCSCRLPSRATLLTGQGHDTDYSRQTLQKPLRSADEDRFAPIFQKAPEPGKNPNFGDRKRLSCFGLPDGPSVKWCTAGQQLLSQIVPDDNYRSIENSVLQTLQEASDQAPHFDLTVEAMPRPDKSPIALIAVTPLFHDGTLRVLPMDAPIAKSLPTAEEFHRHSVPVRIPLGQTLVMRYDIAHCGTSTCGYRLHSVLGQPGLNEHNVGFTMFLE